MIRMYFKPEYEETLSTLITEFPAAINYCAIFDDEAKLSHMVLNRILDKPYQKNKFGKPKEHEYLGGGMLLIKVKDELPVAVNLRETFQILMDTCQNKNKVLAKPLHKTLTEVTKRFMMIFYRDRRRQRYNVKR